MSDVVVSPWVKAGLVDPPNLKVVISAFKEHLYLEDTTALKAILGTVAANHLEEFDPVWMLIVGSSGGGKTELLQPLGALRHVHLVSELSEAGLLSGSPAKDKAKDSTGGLLREIGTFGILIPKDFTTVLAMSRDRRSHLLAALREIYDGNWTRNVGTDGGRTLLWKGKLGFIGGVTNAIDAAHKVTSVMGERFLYCRLPDEGRRQKGSKALERRTSPVKMRHELQEAVRALFDSVNDWTPRESGDWELEAILDRADFVATARSGVERDGHSREVELIMDKETPTRLALQLKALLAGLSVIGVEYSDAWQIVNKVALDSMPQSRRAVIEALYQRPGADTNDVAEVTSYPSTTARRTLEDLRAHGIVRITLRSEGSRPHLWDLTDDSRITWGRIICVPETADHNA